MNKFKQIITALKARYRRYMLRDKFLIAGAQWFSDRGDEFLRLNYSLVPKALYLMWAAT